MARWAVSYFIFQKSIFLSDCISHNPFSLPHRPRHPDIRTHHRSQEASTAANLNSHMRRKNADYVWGTTIKVFVVGLLKKLALAISMTVWHPTFISRVCPEMAHVWWPQLWPLVTLTHQSHRLSDWSLADHLALWLDQSDPTYAPTCIPSGHDGKRGLI